ncbi:ABC transporter ATP-binding protein [Paenibacillus kobensis]|uniref:ABC transporter ATP-binding protein n=1 Tax=Paenibacillus kobensis TaxID=59841 RepID=UPI000FDCD654|nr:ABC transporter ATP-binding protein [Paenibacillus kobensis]
MHSLRWIWPHVKARRWLLALVASLTALQVAADLIGSSLQRNLLNGLLSGDVQHAMQTIIYAMAGLYFVHAVLVYVSPVVSLYNYAGIRLRLSRKLLERADRLPLVRLQRERTNELIGLFLHHAHMVAFAFSDRLFVFVRTGAAAVIFSCFLLWVHPLLFAACAVAAAGYVALSRYFAGRMKQMSGRLWEARNALGICLEEGLSGTREVLAYHRGAWEKQRYDRHFDVYAARVREDTNLRAKRTLAGSPLEWGIRLCALVFGGLLCLQGEISAGAFFVAYLFAGQLLSSLQELFVAGTDIAGHLKHTEYIRAFHEGPSVEEGSEPLAGLEQLAFESATFSYAADAGMPVLKSVSFEIRPGAMTAIVGPSGSGKSTAAALLAGLHEPTEGEVRVNGCPLTSWRQEDWRAKVAYVQQEPFLLHDTLRTNLLLGREASEAELSRALDAAQLSETVASLPDGLDTIIGERGITLSGGQRQRTAIARALLRQPELLILDEATSALDLETERRLQDCLLADRTGRTTVVVAHRLSTIRHADWIIVLQNGEVAEQGTHDTLMADDTLYRRLVQADFQSS